MDKLPWLDTGGYLRGIKNHAPIFRAKVFVDENFVFILYLVHDVKFF
jgi:hypothetical protein